MASTTALRPLLLLARRCRTSTSTSASIQSVWSSTLAGDLFLSARPTATALCLPSSVTTARHFSDDSDKSDSSKKVSNAIESLKLRRPAVGGGGDGGPQQRQQQQRGGGDRRRGGGGGGFRGGRRPFQQQQTAKPAEPPMPDDPFLRTHMIDLFPGNYEEEDASAAAGMENSDDWDDGEEEREYAEVEATMAQLHKESLEYEEKKKRWIENSKPIVRVPVIDDVGRSYGRGARKAAQARVWITPGFGNVTVNRKDFVEYFPRFSDREQILSPMVVTGTCGKFDLQCQVKGGGLTGQAGAVRLGVARALQHWNPEYRPIMKKMGYLTRDARRVERKKTGLVKARKAPQWNRR